ncbi:DUF7577 domain-containing protein [Nocardioides montaniterrae]
MAATPGLQHQNSLRTTFRIIGPILAVLGLAICVSGFVKFVHLGESFSDASPLPAMGMFLGGFVMFGIGMTLARLGFMGAGVRYAAGELAPVAKDSLDYIKGGSAGSAGGPFCRGCGTRNDADASFCDKCGASLA